MNKFIINEFLISISMDSVKDMVEASSSRHPVLVPFILQPFSLSHHKVYFFLTLHCQLHLSMNKRQKKYSNWMPDMTCFATKHLKFEGR